MNEETRESIKQSYRNYPLSWFLEDSEIETLYNKYLDAIRTTNGDTEQVTISARQLILFIRLYMENCY